MSYVPTKIRAVIPDGPRPAIKLTLVRNGRQYEWIGGDSCCAARYYDNVRRAIRRLREEYPDATISGEDTLKPNTPFGVRVALKAALRAATFENASFSFDEAENHRIREQTKLFRESWLIPVIHDLLQWAEGEKPAEELEHWKL